MTNCHRQRNIFCFCMRVKYMCMYELGLSLSWEDFSKLNPCIFSGMWFLRILVYKSPFACKFSWQKTSCHQGKKEVACIVSKPLVSCLWGCGESVNPRRFKGFVLQTKGRPSLGGFFTFGKSHPLNLYFFLHRPYMYMYVHVFVTNSIPGVVWKNMQSIWALVHNFQMIINSDELYNRHFKWNLKCKFCGWLSWLSLLIFWVSLFADGDKVTVG